MSLPPNIDKNLLKLAQLKAKLSSGKISLNEIRSLLRSDFQINYAIPLHCQIQYNVNKFLGHTALHFAVLVNNTKDCNKVIKLLLNSGADFTYKNQNGFTPLRLAFEKYKNNKVSADVKTLYSLLLSAHLKSNNATNPCCNHGISHLHIACLSNNIKVVDFFLKAGVSVNEYISNDSSLYPGYTCLHLAMESENSEMVQLLLKYKAEFLSLNATGLTPLHLIIEKQINDASLSEKSRNRKLLINESILDLFININVNNINLLDFIGLPQLHTYCTRNQSFQNKDLGKFLMNSININYTVRSDSLLWAGYTPLHFAALCNIQTVIFLLKNGADLMAKDANGITPFDLCLEKYETFIIKHILETQGSLASIQLSNGDKLTDILTAFSNASNLEDYLKTRNVNSAIPFDSPLWPGFTLLHLAVILSNGTDRFKVPLCLKYGASITIKDVNNMTALHVAFYMMRKRCINDILDFHSNVSINPIDNKNLSHFHVACTTTIMKIPKMFLDHGENPNVPIQADINLKCLVNLNSKSVVVIPPSSTPLHISVATENKGLTKLLLDYNADPNIRDSYGFTWVHRAFTSNSFEKLKSLLWWPNKVPNANLIAPGGLSYLHVACYAGSLKAVEALLPLTININEPINNDLKKFIENLPAAISIGDTPLHLAVKASSEMIVNLLLENCADVKAKNEKNLCPLHVALLLSKSPKIIKRLGFEFYIKDETKLSHLHIACALKDAVIIKQLLDLGENVHSQINSNSPIWPGETPLSILIKNKYPENDDTVKLLLKHYLRNIENSINDDEDLHELAKRQKVLPIQDQNLFINQEGLSAFHVSCMGNDWNIVETFIRFGVNINAPKDHFATKNAGYTPLHFGVQYGNINVILTLLKYGADVKIENSKGYNPIFLAVLKHFDKVKIFLSACEINLSIKNSFGQTIIDLFLQNRIEISSNDLLNLLKRGAAKNISFLTKLQLLKILFQSLSGDNLKMLIENVPKLTNLDGQSRNILHHLCMHNDYLKTEEFVNNVEMLVKIGCKLDHQDKNGRTPLHYAVLTIYQKKAEDLLQIGADINVIDINRETPYTYCFMNKTNQEIISTCEKFNDYVDKLKSAGLYLNSINEKCSRKNMVTSKRALYMAKLEKMTLPISKSLTIRDLLTEKIIMKYYTMPYELRQQISRCLNYDELHNTFPEWSPLFKLQYRKILNRIKLYGQASKVLQSFINPKIPDLCIKFIFAYLNNEDLKNLIDSKK